MYICDLRWIKGLKEGIQGLFFAIDLIHERETRWQMSKISKQRERERVVQLLINAGRRLWKVAMHDHKRRLIGLLESFSNVSVSDNAEIFRLIQTDAARLI